METKRGYWLTVYAQDHGVVPLSSSLQVSVSTFYKFLRFVKKIANPIFILGTNAIIYTR